MKQYEAVIQVMEENGGYATLGYLNQTVPKIPGCKWHTKTPFASIRRIVQDERFFFKIRPGLWALKTHKDQLPPEALSSEEQQLTRQEEYSHTYFQGLLVEVGNLKAFKTTVPSQDGNRVYLGKRLHEITTIPQIYPFGYDHLVRTAASIDVIWFNEREMPDSLFEVEHFTDIRGSLLKFVELQDFNANFCVVADEVRRREFQTKLCLQAFRPIAKRVGFWSYEDVAELHAKTSELVSIEARLRS